MLMEHQIFSHSTESVLNRQVMASTAVMIILALNIFAQGGLTPMRNRSTLAQHSTAQHSLAQANCALLASCDREAFETEYYIRDG